MSWLLAGEPALDVNDIQGHILVGFGGAPQALGVFTVTDPLRAAAVLSGWARNGTITSARALLPRKGNRATAFITALGPWVGVAVSARLLTATGAPAKFNDPWLINPGGMRQVSSALNDPPDRWVLGEPDTPVDVLIVAAAAESVTALQLVGSFADAAKGAISATFIEELTPLPGNVEHFGFTDGLSQPALIGTVDGQPFEERAPDTGGSVPYARPGQDLIWPGHFLFGYPRRDRFNPRLKGPLAAAGNDPKTNAFARNGSLLVYRRLTQDVAAFRSFCAAHAPPGIDPPTLQARIIGRWPSGLPIAHKPEVRAPDHSDPLYNDFTFLNDAMAGACPLSAHIRKVNPRLGGSDLDNAVPRLLRRGVPFGAPYQQGETHPPANGRGLAFLAYQASIKSQFGAITTEWVNDSTAPNNGGGQDFLIGQLPNPQTAQRFFDVPPQIRDGHTSWIAPTGGAFLFAPSLTALKQLDTFR